MAEGETDTSTDGLWGKKAKDMEEEALKQWGKGRKVFQIVVDSKLKEWIQVL